MRTAKDLARSIEEWFGGDPLRANDRDELVKMVQAIQTDAQAPRPVLTEYQLSEEDLRQMEALYAATTQAEWRCPKHSIAGSCYIEAHSSEGHRWGILGSMAGAEREANRGNANFIVSAHNNFPALLHDLTQAKALLEDAQEEGMTDRIQARLDTEYQRGFDEGMEAAFEERSKKWRDKIGGQPSSPLADIPGIVLPGDPDFPDDVYDVLSHLEEP